MKKLTEEVPEEMTPEELQKRFEKVESQSAECKWTSHLKVEKYIVILWEEMELVKITSYLSFHWVILDKSTNLLIISCSEG